MLEGHSERICTFFAAEYEPQIGFATKLSDAAEAAQAKVPFPHWAFASAGYLLRDPQHRLLVNLNFRQTSAQTLGLNVWQQQQGEYGSLFQNILEKMNIKVIKRLDFKFTAYLLLGMSHPEMSDLLFGSFLVPAIELENVCGKAEDALVQIHGNYKKMKLRLVVAPMTVDQAAQQFLATPNLELFLEPRLLDTGVKDFQARLAAPCLYVEVDLTQADCMVRDLPLFLKESLEGAQLICEQAVLRLKSLQPKKG